MDKKNEQKPNKKGREVGLEPGIYLFIKKSGTSVAVKVDRKYPEMFTNSNKKEIIAFEQFKKKNLKEMDTKFFT